MADTLINGEAIQNKEEKDSMSFILLKALFKDSHLTTREFIALWNKTHPDNITSEQALSNKLRRDSLRINELWDYLDVLGYSINFEKIEKPKPKQKVQKPDKRKFEDEIQNGMDEVKGVHFKSILIAGENASEAANFLSEHLSENMTDSQELLILLTAIRNYQVMIKPIK